MEAASTEPRKGGPPRVALPLEGRAKAAVVLILISGIATIVSLFADLDRLSLAGDLVDGERVTLEDADASDDRVASAWIVYIVALLLSGVTFLLWFSRAYRNTIALGMTHPRYGTRWVIWHWFIPIVSLFRPKQAMNDIWRGSDPDLPSPTGAVSGRPVTPLLHWWWAFWLLSTFIGNYAARISLGADTELQTPDEFRQQAVAYVVTDVAELLTVPLAIAVVVVVTRRQEERRKKLAREHELAGASPAAEPAA